MRGCCSPLPATSKRPKASYSVCALPCLSVPCRTAPRSNLEWQAAEAKATGKITYPITKEQAEGSKFAAVDTRDVAGAATAILLAPKEAVDKLLEVRMVEVRGCIRAVPGPGFVIVGNESTKA